MGLAAVARQHRMGIVTAGMRELFFLHPRGWPEHRLKVRSSDSRHRRHGRLLHHRAHVAPDLRASRFGTSAIFLPIHHRAIDSVLHVGTYEKAISSEDDHSEHWRAAARRVVKGVTAWLIANRAIVPQAR